MFSLLLKDLISDFIFHIRKHIEKSYRGLPKIDGTQKVKMPCKNKNIFFMNYHKQLMAPFVIYADFECITVPIKEKRGKNCRLSRA